MRKEFDLRLDAGTRRAWVNGRELSIGESLQYLRISPDGFNWGYGGSGPSQLALAICLALFGKRATDYYQSLKWALISEIPGDVDFEGRVYLVAKDGKIEIEKIRIIKQEK